MNTREIKVIVGVFLLLSLFSFASAQMFPPYPVNGHIVDEAGNSIIGANVTLNYSNISYIKTIKSTTKGEYIFSLDKYYNGDKVTLTATHEAKKNTTIFTINTSKGYHAVDLIVRTEDERPPVITITSPKDNTSITMFDKKVTMEVSDESPPIVTKLYLNGSLVNTSTVSSSPSSLKVEVFYRPNATNILNASATDSWNNINYSNIVFVFVWPNQTTAPANLTAGNSTFVNLTNQTIIEIAANATIDGSVKVTADSNLTRLNATVKNTTYGLKPGEVSLNRYIEINATNIAIGNLFYVNITLFYSNDDLDLNKDGDIGNAGDIDESKLKIYWYSAKRTEWLPLDPKGKNYSNPSDPEYTPHGPEVKDIFPDPENNKLTVKLNHFSTFALVGPLVTAPPPPSAAPGGGGGGGVTSGEDPKNIEKREIRDEFLRKDVPASYKFVTPEIPVREVIIIANLNADLISVQVELLKNTSTLVTQPAPGEVYKNINIWAGTAGFATPKNIKEAIIKFRVENSWMSANNVQAGDISMLRWNSTWSRIEAKEISRDVNYTYFEAMSYAFSPFAIAAKVPEIVPIVTPPVVTPVTPEPTPPVTPAPPVPPIPAWVYAIIIIVIVAVAVYFLVLRKKEEEKK